MDEDDLLDLFGKAMACAILGKIGPQRSRVLQLIVAVSEAGAESACCSHYFVDIDIYVIQDPRLQQIAALKPKYEAHASLLVCFSRAIIIAITVILSHGIVSVSKRIVCVIIKPPRRHVSA